MNSITINNVTDFDLTHIFECGQCFRWVPSADGRGYAGAAGGNAARMEFADGTLRIETTGGDEEYWKSYFDLGTDYGVIKRSLISNEPRIEAACGYGSGIRILRQDPFETIISFIISQNNNIPRIRKNIESLCAEYGREIEGSEGIAALRGCGDGGPVHAFPDAETLADASADDLAAMKLGYRSEYIIRAARKYAGEGCPECREELLDFHGVGPKVANCIMLFGFRDMAAFPVDTWVRHIMNDMYGFDEKDAKGMQAFAEEHFGELAGYAQQYLFYYYRDRS